MKEGRRLQVYKALRIFAEVNACLNVHLVYKENL